MMTPRPLDLLRARLRAWLRDERGTISIEAIFMLPMLCWCYVGMLLFFDAFRQQSIAEKAAYTISDAISREVEIMTPDYFKSLWRMQRFLTESNEKTGMRVTVFSYDEDNDDYDLRWWLRRGPNVPSMNDGTLNAADFTKHVPLMYDGEVLIMVETWTEWQPWFDVGIPTLTFESAVVTRPRYAPQVCYANKNDYSGWTKC